jgi:uncharacterized membrane protein YqjE
MPPFDQLLLGDEVRRAAFGATLIVLASIALGCVEWRVRRSGSSYLDHRGACALGMTLAPIGVALVLSAQWGLLGAAVFVGVAIAVCGVGVVALLVRGVV